MRPVTMRSGIGGAELVLLRSSVPRAVVPGVSRIPQLEACGHELKGIGAGLV